MIVHKRVDWPQNLSHYQLIKNHKALVYPQSYQRHRQHQKFLLFCKFLINPLMLIKHYLRRRKELFYLLLLRVLLCPHHPQGLFYHLRLKVFHFHLLHQVLLCLLHLIVYKCILNVKALQAHLTRNRSQTPYQSLFHLHQVQTYKPNVLTGNHWRKKLK